MLKQIRNIIVFGALTLLFLIGVQRSAQAQVQEITAIDFNGDQIGKVIPDGTVVSFDNEIIGTITADSFVIDSKGNPIGGIVPQGVVIGNDNKLMGRVHADGSVRTASGKIVGKTLPNGLVVDDSYNILGAVIYPGLVYNDQGQTVGRLTGNGSYVTFEGQGIGFVSADGYAYRYNGVDYVLDGRLIATKIVVNEKGDFTGSVVPGGKVTDSEAKEIGRIHANGYVYDADGNVIGQAVSAGYAFDNFGKYLGLVSYNGEVIHQGKTVAKLRDDGKIIDSSDQVIGFKVDLTATASDEKGKYLGRLLPSGKIVRARETVGIMGAKGVVYNEDGNPIGRIVQTGPIFDYLGNLKAQALSNASVISLTGTPLGFMKGRLAFDNIGRLMGSVLKPSVAFDESNALLGLSGIGSGLNVSGRSYIISPFGYVFSSDYMLSGHAVPLDAVYAENGVVAGYISPDGHVDGLPREEELILTQFAQVIDKENQMRALSINPLFATDLSGQTMGMPNQTNLITDIKGKVVGKVVPEYLIVSKDPDSQMPVLGNSGHGLLAIGINGTLLGYANDQAQVSDYAGNKVGQVFEGNLVMNTQKAVVAELADLSAVINNECTFLGVLGTRGKVHNSRDIVLGSMLTNGQVISEVGNVIGHRADKGVVINFDGKTFATVNASGRAVDYARQDFGCLQWNGKLYNHEGALIGRRVSAFPVMSFDNQMIGRVRVDGQVIDEKGRLAGFVQPDDTVIDAKGKEKGVVFKYRFAFDNDNVFMGRVDQAGQVLNDADEVVGTVAYDGAVYHDDAVIGYALYDLYIYNDKQMAIGYLVSDGSVSDFSGGRLGKSDKGFLVDRNYTLIGRGNRDYVVRDEDWHAVGELTLDGELISRDGSVLGTLGNKGEIADAQGNLVAKARVLQYYDIVRPGIKKPADWSDDRIRIEPVTVPEDEEENNEDDDINKKFNLKAIGIALTPDGNYLGDILANNDVVDKAGNLLGKKMSDGLIMDDDGNLIGIEEVKNKSADQMFVPAGTFGPGGAYGTGNLPTNLGPGGGFGPGERYDPVRSSALAAAQAARRSEIAVGQLSTTIKREDFDGRQDNWDGATFRLSSWRVDMSEMILADKPIPAVLARSIISFGSGGSGSGGSGGSVPVTAYVERNVYAEDGRNVVIPAGSHVIGESGNGGSDTSNGSTSRVQITWKRLIRPDGSAFELTSAQTGDAQGRAGTLGYVDEQLLKKYSLPVAISMLESGMSYVMATDETSSGETENSKQQAASDARQNFLNQMDTIFQDILNNKLQIQAATYVPAGTRIIIFPMEDLWIRTIERGQKMDENQLKERPTDLINPDARSSDGAGGGKSSGGGSSTQGVVYEDEDVDVKPSTPLIASDSKKKTTSQTTVPPVTTTGATPPPPSTNVSSGSSSDAQLF